MKPRPRATTPGRSEMDECSPLPAHPAALFRLAARRRFLLCDPQIFDSVNTLLRSGLLRSLAFWSYACFLVFLCDMYI